MAVTKQYTQHMDDAGRRDKVQTLTAASTATEVSNFGVTIISASTQSKTFQLAAPKSGIRKTIALTGGSTAGDTTIDGNGATISASTAVSFATGVSGGIELVGISTAAWVLVANSGGTLS